MRTLLAAAALFLSAPAQAFCGFYVSGADASLYNNATMVVLMREGRRTVLSMQNSYQGPPENFAMVVPVPQVLTEDNVKTLPADIFGRVDQLAAPRLVEYWETDPCAPQIEYDYMVMESAGSVEYEAGEGADDDLGVTIEAQFTVGEYEVVILSAADSSGLDTWLKREKYNIPAGAEPVLRPYVEAGTKFFVAKVDVSKVTFADGRAVLSPLRMHYDTDTFQLPVRLGLLNSAGEQDLLVHVVARGQRYEVANFDNAFIPTNIRVLDGVRDSFGGFYEALFRETVASKKNTVVTEYSWDASSCDPCPTPALSGDELATLGTDVLGGEPWGWVLTRMHYRYTAEGLGEDLVFRAAPPIVGGRGTPDEKGEMREAGAKPGSVNNFQGRYIILHPWEGALACESPRRGQWGGPPTGADPGTRAAESRIRSGGAAKVVELPTMLAEDIPEIGVRAVAAAAVPPETSTPGGGEAPSKSKPCGCTSGPIGAGAAFLVGLVLLRRRRA